MNDNRARSKPPGGAVPQERSGGTAPFGIRLEYFDALEIVECPSCHRPIEWGVTAGYEPHFLLHPRTNRSDCRLCVFRHPVSKRLCLRTVPGSMSWQDYYPIVVAELRAIAGKAGML